MAASAFLVSGCICIFIPRLLSVQQRFGLQLAFGIGIGFGVGVGFGNSTIVSTHRDWFGIDATNPYLLQLLVDPFVCLLLVCLFVRYGSDRTVPVFTADVANLQRIYFYFGQPIRMSSFVPPTMYAMCASLVFHVDL